MNYELAGNISNLVRQADDRKIALERKGKLHVNWASIYQVVETHGALAQGTVSHDNEVEVEAGG